MLLFLYQKADIIKRPPQSDVGISPYLRLSQFRNEIYVFRQSQRTSENVRFNLLLICF